MSRVCEICGKGPQYGAQISHAHNVTKKRWNANVKKIKVLDNKRVVKKVVCTRCLKAGKVVKP